MYPPGDCKILWAQDEAGEIGKKPAPDPGTFEISAETYTLIHERLAARQKKVRR